MENKVLIAYASKYGSTREIAEKIGDVLQQAGLEVDVLAADQQDLSHYKAVILGAALYIGKWPKDAEKFVTANEKALAGKPVWVFSSGPSGEGDPLELVEGQRLPANMQAVVDRIQPREVSVFHGNIDPDRISFMEKWAIKNVVKKPLGDYRDWDMIAAWAGRVAAALKGPTPSA